MKNIKKIKSWKLFIEGKQLDLFQGTFFENPELKYEGGLSPVSQEDILRELEPFEDENYIVKVEFGTIDENDEFKENIPLEPFVPCVLVTIIGNQKTTDVNLTLRLKSFNNRMKKKFDRIIFKLTPPWPDSRDPLRTRDYVLKIDEIVVEDGCFKFNNALPHSSKRLLIDNDDITSNELKISMVWFNEI